ncbi:anthrone oxygenase family protein [Sphaerisporangium sp. B11E5]|uniref:anthrone oxygenase family protein n=1 Tax=Sphaerisporangium sp. B11E5 TaxID=3153563 RepID=UPI00325C8697
MSPLQTAVLLAAVVTTGLTAGLFAVFAHAVMPAFARSSDRVLVEGMQNINRTILNPLFMICFLGPIPLLIAAVAVLWGDPSLPWLIAALVLYVGSFIVTIAGNVPLNNRLDQAGDPDRVPDLGAVRRAFEPRWVTLNLVRTIGHTLAFACAAYALALA